MPDTPGTQRAARGFGAATLLAGIEEILNQCEGLGSEQMRERVRRHLLSQLLCLGRHTLTGVLGTSGRLFCDWSADYRMYSSERVEPEKLFTPVRQSLTGQLAEQQPLVAALDDTRLRKTGRKTHGVKYTRDPMGPAFHVNFIKAQRFIQISMASPADNGMARMVPIDFVHAPAPQKPRPDALNFSSFVSHPYLNTKPKKLDMPVGTALFYAIA